MTDNTNTGTAPKMSKFDVGAFLGKGCWKEAWYGKRKTDNTEWALKPLRRTDIALAQSVERGLSVDDYWDKESLGGHSTAYSNIAFSYIDVDDDGERIQVEEYIDRFLSDYVKNTPKISLEEILHISKGMSNGLDDWHNQIKRVHGDFKFDNTGYTTNRIIKITDKGTSTVGKRNISNIGYILTRAPENFSGKKTNASDVWSFGSMLYAMLHPDHKYLFEDEFNASENAIEFGSKITELYNLKGCWNNVINTKIEALDVPKYMHRLLRMTLFHEKDRLAHGGELRYAVLKAEKLYEHDTPKHRMKRNALMTAAAVLIGVGVYFGGAFVHNSNVKLKETEEKAEFNEKLSLLKAYYTGVDNGLNIFTTEKIDAYIDFFGDKRTAALAFLYPDIAVKAYSLSGGKKDYDSLKPYVDSLSWEAEINSRTSTSDYRDGWMWSEISKVRDKTIDAFYASVAQYKLDSTNLAKRDSIQRRTQHSYGGQFGLTMEQRGAMQKYANDDTLKMAPGVQGTLRLIGK